MRSSLCNYSEQKSWWFVPGTWGLSCFPSADALMLFHTDQFDLLLIIMATSPQIFLTTLWTWSGLDLLEVVQLVTPQVTAVVRVCVQCCCLIYALVLLSTCLLLFLLPLTQTGRMRPPHIFTLCSYFNNIFQLELWKTEDRSCCLWCPRLILQISCESDTVSGVVSMVTKRRHC